MAGLADTQFRLCRTRTTRYYGGSFNSVKESLFGIAKVTVGDVILLAFRFLTFRALIVNGILEISR